MPHSIAVIGAGVAGLSCARALAGDGFHVTVFEASEHAGGRAATRKTELGSFDFGAQYFTVRDTLFEPEVLGWLEQGVAAPWDARVVRLLDGQAPSRKPLDPIRYVGVPSMSAIATHMSAGLDLRLEQPVRSIERVSGGAAARWALKRPADPGELTGIEITEGLYDAVVVATPAPEAEVFLESSAELLGYARRVRLEPCWALMLAFDQSLPLEYDAAFVSGKRLCWIARDSSKPGRRSGERWIAHAPTAWSQEHFQDDPDEVRFKLAKAFADTTGSAVQPVYAAVHRWHYSVPVEPLSIGCLWSAHAGIGVCGDWLSGARLEGAWTSGRELARQIRATMA